MPSSTLFISYTTRSQASVDLAHELAHSLRNGGYEVFLDKDDLPVGESFDERIARAIERSDGMIFLAAPEALEPGAYTLTELGRAKRKWRSGRGRVLPVMLCGVRPQDLDAYLRVLSPAIPTGNARAEVHAEVRRLWPPSRRHSIWMYSACLSAELLLAYLAYDKSHWIFSNLDFNILTPTRFGGQSGQEKNGMLMLENLAQDILFLIRRSETRDEYDVMYAPRASYPEPPLSRMTLRQVADLLESMGSTDVGPRVGAYALKKRELHELAQAMGISMGKVFSPKMQSLMATELLKQRGLKDFLSGELDPESFANNLARQWPSLPVVTNLTRPDGIVVRRGESFYKREGGLAVVAPETVLRRLRELWTAAAKA